VSLVYDLKAKTASVNGSTFTGIDMVTVWGVGVASGVVDFKENKATLTFSQPVNARVEVEGVLRVTPVQPPPAPPPPETRRRRRRKTLEAWTPGAGVSAAAERALSAVEPLAGPLLFRRDYEFPRATFIDYDGSFYWVTVKYLEDSEAKETTITRRLKRAVLSNLEAQGLYAELRSAYYLAFIEVDQGGLRVQSTRKPFYVKVAGRELTVGPSRE
jgi:hypothetical protein